jgi:hypothetical protein
MPQSWVSPIDDLPLLLLGHFIIGLVLALYLVARFWVRRKVKAGEPMIGSCKFLAAASYGLAALCFAMAMLGAGKQVEAQVKFGRRLLTFDAFGWL